VTAQKFNRSLSGNLERFFGSWRDERSAQCKAGDSGLFVCGMVWLHRFFSGLLKGWCLG
jgi:hypothetical protein